VEGFDVGDFGFEIDDLPQVVMPTDKQGEGEGEPQTEVKEDDFDPDAHYETKVKLGEVWQLGEHRLMCGDSTMPEDVTKLMAGERADMIFTDPPYGVDIKAVGNKQNRILGDLTQTAIPFSFDTACRFGLKPKAHLYFCGAEKNFAMYDKLFDRYLHNLPRHLIWVKNGFTMKRNGYHNQYEVIYFGYTEGAGDIWYGGRKEEDASDVWRINKDKASDYVHPTQKPIEIPARAIRNSSPVGGSVLDLFGGSGSTMIAAEQLGRKCFMMELDPHYCTVIIARWEKLTGLKAVKLNE
jgi:DNA modification methylase